MLDIKRLIKLNTELKGLYDFNLKSYSPFNSVLFLLHGSLQA